MLTIEHWGRIEYRTAWERQKELQSAVQRGERDSTLVLCEHPTVITIGKEGGRHNIVLSDAELTQRGVDVVSVNRGGDVTLHNAGQLVGYTMFRLTDYKPDLHWFLREIEECIIETIATFGIEGGRYAGYTGVWIEHARKICAIGIHCSRWVTSHGFALNVVNDVREFDGIIPCGISDKAVTSVQAEHKGAEVQDDDLFAKVQEVCAERFLAHFL
jgi:lipoyl(octanoyl) transferase